MGYGNGGLPIDLAKGYYRPVFVGSTDLSHTNSPGSSEIVINIWTSGGLPITEYAKTVTSNGVSERSFQYVYMSDAGQLLIFARASTNCGTAALSGASVNST